MVDRINTIMELSLEVSEQLRQVHKLANEFQRASTSSLGLYKNAENLKKPLVEIASTGAEAAAAVKDLSQQLALAEKASVKAAANSALLKQQRAEQRAQDSFIGSESIRSQETILRNYEKIGNSFNRQANIRQQIAQNQINLETLTFQKQQASANLGQLVSKLGSYQGVVKENLLKKIEIENNRLNEIKQKMADIVRLDQLREKIQDQINNRLKQQAREQAKLQKAAEQQAAKDQRQAEKEAEKAVSKRPQESRLDRILEDGGASLLQIQARLLINYQLINSVLGTVRFGVTFVKEMDEAFHQLQAIVGLTDTQMTKLKVNILDVAKNSKFSATEVAQAAIILGQAGFSNVQIRESLKAINDLATAAGTTLSTAVNNVTSVLNVFQYGADQTASVANLMTSALNLSKLSMDQITLGIQYAANTAFEAKVPFSEMIATFGALADAGIRSGSTIGTGYRKLLQDLLNPTEKFQKRVAELGLSLDQLDVQTRGVGTVLNTLKSAGFTAADAMATLDVRAAAVLVPLLRSADAIALFQQKLYLTESTISGSEKQMQSLTNSVNKLKNSFGTVVFDTFEGLVSVLASVATGFADLMNTVTPFRFIMEAALVSIVTLTSVALAGQLIRLISNLTGLGAAFKSIATGTALIRSGALVTSFATLFEGLRAGLGVVFSLRVAFHGLAAAAGPIGLALVALSYGVVALMDAFKNTDTLEAAQTRLADLEAETAKYQQRTDQLNTFIKTLIEQYEDLSQNSEQLKAKTLEAGLAFNKMGTQVIQAGDSIDVLIGKMKILSKENAIAAQRAQEAQLAQLDLTDAKTIAESKDTRKDAESELRSAAVSANFIRNDELKTLIKDIQTSFGQDSAPAGAAINEFVNRIARLQEQQVKDGSVGQGAGRILETLGNVVQQQRNFVNDLEKNRVTRGQLEKNISSSSLDAAEIERILTIVAAKTGDANAIKKGFAFAATPQATQAARDDIQKLIDDVQIEVDRLKGKAGSEGSTSLLNAEKSLADLTSLRIDLDKKTYAREKDRLEVLNKDADLVTRSAQIRAQIGSLKEAEVATQTIINQAKIKEKNAIEEAIAFTRSDDFLKKKFTDLGLQPPKREDLANNPAVKKYIEQAAQQAALDRQNVVDAANKSLTTRKFSVDPAIERGVITDFQQFRFQLQESTIAYKAQIDAIEGTTRSLQAQRASLDLIRNKPFVGSGARFLGDLALEDRQREESIERKAAADARLAQIREEIAAAEKFSGISIADAQRNAAQGIDFAGNAIGTKGTKGFKLDQQQAKQAQQDLLKLAEAQRKVEEDVAKANAEFEKFGRILTENEPLMKTLDDSFKEFAYTSYYGSLALSEDFKKLFGQIKNGFSDVVKNFANGTKSIGQSFKDLGATILSTLLDIATQRATQGIFDSIFEAPSTIGSSATGGGFFTSALSFLGFASGGRVTGGQRGRDSVPSMLMPDEYVIKAPAARAIGFDTLDRLNNGNANIQSQASSVSRIASNDNGKAEVNVYVVRPDAVPPMGPNDVVAVISDNIARGGEIKQLIKSVQV